MRTSVKSVRICLCCPGEASRIYRNALDDFLRVLNRIHTGLGVRFDLLGEGEPPMACRYRYVVLEGEEEALPPEVEEMLAQGQAGEAPYPRIYRTKSGVGNAGIVAGVAVDEPTPNAALFDAAPFDTDLPGEVPLDAVSRGVPGHSPENGGDRVLGVSASFPFCPGPEWLNLDLLLALLDSGAAMGSPCLREGQVLLDEIPLLSFQTLPLYHGMEELLWQRQEQEKRDAALEQLRRAYRQEPANPAIPVSLDQISREREESDRQMQAMEASLLDLCRFLCRTNPAAPAGFPPSQVCSLLLEGRWEAALEILRNNAVSGGDALLRLQNNSLRIAVLHAMGTAEAERERMDRLGTAAAWALLWLFPGRGSVVSPEALQTGIPLAMDALRDYAAALYRQGEYRAALDWCEQMERGCREIGFRGCPLTNCLLLQAKCRLADGQTEAAQDALTEALSICETWFGTGARMPDDESARLLDAAEELADLLEQEDRIAEAQRLLRLLPDACRLLAARGGVRWEPRLAAFCTRLATVLRNACRFQEAEALLCEALDLYRKLALTRPTVYTPYAATVCRSLGLLLWEAGRRQAAEWFYRQALDSFRILSEQNAVAYTPAAAEVCGELANLLGDLGRRTEAEPLLRAALGAWRNLLEWEPLRYQEDAAKACGSLAVFLLASAPSESRDLFQEALAFYETGRPDHPEAKKIRMILSERFAEDPVSGDTVSTENAASQDSPADTGSTENAASSDSPGDNGRQAFH